jgi:hypothetical protein
VFAVIGDLASGPNDGTGGDLCIVQGHVPYIEFQNLPKDLATAYYPYYFAPGRFDLIYRNFAFAAARLGYFSSSHGFRLLGDVYEDCDATVDAGLIGQLNAAGVPSSEILRFDLGCPPDFASPSSLEQAVLQFKQAGVTTVTFDEAADPDLPNFTKLAEQQGFRPQYVFADSGVVGTTNEVSSSGVDTTNLNGAIAITPTQIGALSSSPQVPLSSATASCDLILNKAGLPPTEKSADGFGGAACNDIWMFTAAASHAAQLSGVDLAAGLQAAGSVPFAYPSGPNTTSAPGTTTLGQYWRPVQFVGSCNCWRVLNPSFSPPF